jgi:hypothetical protein
MPLKRGPSNIHTGQSDAGHQPGVMTDDNMRVGISKRTPDSQQFLGPFVSKKISAPGLTRGSEILSGKGHFPKPMPKVNVRNMEGKG